MIIRDLEIRDIEQVVSLSNDHFCGYFIILFTAAERRTRSVRRTPHRRCNRSPHKRLVSLSALRGGLLRTEFVTDLHADFDHVYLEAMRVAWQRVLLAEMIRWYRNWSIFPINLQFFRFFGIFDIKYASHSSESGLEREISPRYVV